MQVIPKGQLALNHFRGAFAFQTQPAISIPDFTLNSSLGNASDVQDLVADALVGGAYAKPLFVPHHQRLGTVTGGTVVDRDDFLGSGLPAFIWDSVTFTGAHGKVQCFPNHPYDFQELDFVWDSETAPTGFSVDARGYFSMPPPVDAEDGTPNTPGTLGFILFFSRTIYNRIPVDADAYWDLRCVIGTHLYSLKVGNTEFAQFRRSDDDGATWKTIAANVKLGSNAYQAMGNALPGTGSGTVPIEVQLLNGQLQYKIGAQTVPLSFPVDSPGSPPVIREIRVKGNYFTQLGLACHPLKWGCHCSLRSNPLTLGFSPQNDPYYYLTGILGSVQRASGAPWNTSFPEGSAVTVTRYGPSTAVEHLYDLELDNPVCGTYGGVDYSHYTPVVTRVTVHVDGIWDTAQTGWRAAVPKEVTERVSFDPVGLTINQNLDFTMDNFRGQWSGQSGTVAVRLNLGYHQPSTAYFSRFTGFCDTYQFHRPDASRAICQFQGQSLMDILGRQVIFAPPLMDGWNHYYAMAFLAQYGGFTLAQLAFQDLVPSDPFSYTGADPEPYFLPIGIGQRPWTPRNRDMTVQQLMNYVRQPTGFLLYFDATGLLRYEKWLPSAAGTPTRIFTQGAAGIDGSALTEYWNFCATSSVAQTRNQVVLIGIDPYDPRWQLIIHKLEDTESIYAEPNAEPANYLGYRSPFVWTDSRFANQAFAATAAARLYEMLRIPSLEATFTTWLQPDLYPMDLIYVDEPKSGMTGVPFYIMSITNRWAYEGSRQVLTSTIHGKYLVQ